MCGGFAQQTLLDGIEFSPGEIIGGGVPHIDTDIGGQGFYIDQRRVLGVQEDGKNQTE
jgi:hypothetical protein